MSVDWLERIRHHPRLLPPGVRARNGGDSILALLAQYAATERLPVDEMEARQRARLGELARHAAARSPHFAARLKAAGLTPNDLAAPGGLQALPPLTRDQVMSAGDALFCQSAPREHGRIETSTTSGSTGQPVTIRKTEFCLRHWLANALRVHLWYDHDFGDRLAVLRANVDEELEQPGWGSPCELLFSTGRLSARPVTRSVADWVDWLIHFQPQHILALPSCLAELVGELERTGRRLPGLRNVRTLSETVSDELREEVWRFLGLKIVDHYSSVEGGIIATQCPEGDTYHVSEQLILEVVDEENRPRTPGQTGRILLTHLGNFATPLIRYEIGDYAEVGAPCICGRTMKPLRRLLGRERNLVLMPDGSRRWPRVGFQRWSEIFPVRQFQFIQSAREEITARMYAHSRPSSRQEARLAGMIQTSLGHPFRIRFEWRNKPLPRQRSGKFEEFCRQLN